MKPRIIAALLSLSAAGLVSLVGWEGYSQRAIIPVAGDVPTIGFGSTRRDDGSPVRMGDTITPQAALARTQREIRAEFEPAIRKCVHVPLTQGEFDAYTSLAYNIGANAFCRSTLVRKLNAKDYSGACLEILRWDKFNGRKLAGLTARRKSEYAQCMGQS